MVTENPGHKKSGANLFSLADCLGEVSVNTENTVSVKCPNCGKLLPKSGGTFYQCDWETGCDRMFHYFEDLGISCLIRPDDE